MTPHSLALFEKAKHYIPGGVNSPVRAFQGVGGSPIFFERGNGAYLYDHEGKQYIDFVNSWGPMILGHCPASVLAQMNKTLQKGWSFGAPTQQEVELAEAICNLVPSVEQIRMVNSGTEATMTALRLARGYTQKNIIVKFEGCYHGHSDSLLIKAGSGGLTLSQPSSLGVPLDIAKYTLNLEYNNPASVEEAFAQYGEDIACIILEPIAGNMGCVLPSLPFLQTCQTLCNKTGALLIFDEVITGFRVALGGAQSLYAITPDLTTFGKIIGGGMPVGAVGGKKAIMSYLAPQGTVYQAGTLSGNPLAMTAGLATLEKLKTPDFYTNLHMHTETLVKGIAACAKAHKINLQINWTTGLFSLFFTNTPVHSFKEVMRSDASLFSIFYHAMLKEGVYFAPSAYESAFVCAAHTPAILQTVLDKIERVFSSVRALRP